jgi:hypothetical protein
LCGACEGDNPKLSVIQKLIEKKADPKALRNLKNRKNAFHYICDNRNCVPEIVKHFLNLDKDLLNIKDDSLDTPFVKLYPFFFHCFYCFYSQN